MCQEPKILWLQRQQFSPSTRETKEKEQQLLLHMREGENKVTDWHLLLSPPPLLLCLFFLRRWSSIRGRTGSREGERERHYHLTGAFSSAPASTRSGFRGALSFPEKRTSEQSSIRCQEKASRDSITKHTLESGGTVVPQPVCVRQDDVWTRDA